MSTHRRREGRPPVGPTWWTNVEVEFLKDNYRALGPRGVADALKRGLRGVTHKARQIGVTSKRWTKEDFQYIRDHYEIDGAKKVAAALCRRAETIIQMAERLCVKSAQRDALPTLQARVVIARIASEHKVTSGDMLSISRRKKVCLARWQVMRELRDRGYSLGKIGQCFGMDHTTIMAGLKRHAEMMQVSQCPSV